MQSKARSFEDYLNILKIDGPKLFYGNIDYSKLFEDDELMERLVIDNSNKIIKNIYDFGELTQNEKLVLDKIKFECEVSTSLTAKAIKVNDNYVIRVSSGIIRFLSLLNCIVISYYDHFETLIANRADKETLNETNAKFGQALFDSFNYFQDKYNFYRHIEIKIPVSEKGFFNLFKSTTLKELDPIYGSTNHQLEFIIIHEIAHILYPSNDEFECDNFALKVSRNIWKKTSYHTIVCEFYQLVTFIYYDFHEKYFEVQEFTIEKWNNKDKEYLKFKTHKFNHTRAIERFKNVLNNLNSLSEYCKLHIYIANNLFDFTLDSILYKELELIHFYNVTNIEKQIRIQKYLHGKLDFDETKENAAELKQKINSQIHTTDTEFWSKYNELGSPFCLYFIGNQFTDKEIVETNILKMKTNIFQFFNATIKRFGNINESKAYIEAKNRFVIMRAE